MKHVRYCSFFLFMLVLATNQVSGQQQLSAEVVSDLQKTTQYAFVLTQDRHFRGVLSMYDKLVASGVTIADYEIVVKGKVVLQLKKGSELESLYQKYKDKVRVSVCSVAMSKLGVSADELIPGLIPVETASIRMLQLQARGYNTLTY